MVSYGISKSFGNRVFVISPYHTNEAGKLVAQIPEICPKGQEQAGEEPCRISINHYRQRKTGPEFRLTVINCRSHRIGFTLYPPGHFPYGRQLLSPDTTIEGGVAPLEPVPDNEVRSRLVSYEGTVFEAALDANRLKIWPKEGIDGSLTPRFNTQLRNLNRASLLLGIHPDLSDKQRDGIAAVLALPGQLVCDARNLFEQQSSVRVKGQTICRLLLEVSSWFSIYHRLLSAGSQANLWPTPRFVNPITRRLKPVSFPWVGIRGPP